MNPFSDESLCAFGMSPAGPDRLPVGPAVRIARAAIAGFAAMAMGAVGCGPKIALGPRNSDGKASTEIRMERARNEPARKGVQLAEAGDYKGAAAAFREAVRLNPDDDKAYFNLGLMLEKTGDFRGARDAYRRASEIDNSSKYREAQVRSQSQLLAAGRRDGDVVANMAARLRDAAANRPDAGKIATDRPTGPTRNGGDNLRVLPRDLRLNGDAVPPDPEIALRSAPKPRRPLAADGGEIAPSVDRGGNALSGQALPDPLVPPIGSRPAPVEDPAKPTVVGEAAKEPVTLPAVPAKPERGQPRVLVVQGGRAADKPDELTAASAQAAAEVGWHLLQLGGVLLVDPAGVAEEPAAALKNLDDAGKVERLAKAGRDAGADILIVVSARVSPQAELPNRLDSEVRGRVIRCDVNRELEAVSAKDSAAGDRRDATARLVVGQACEQLAKKLPALVAADWKREK